MHAVDLHWRLANPQRFGGVLTHAELAAASAADSGSWDRRAGLSHTHALLVACIHPVAHHPHAQRLIWHYDIHLLRRDLTAGRMGGLHDAGDRSPRQPRLPAQPRAGGSLLRHDDTGADVARGWARRRNRRCRDRGLSLARAPAHPRCRLGFPGAVRAGAIAGGWSASTCSRRPITCVTSTRRRVRRHCRCCTPGARFAARAAGWREPDHGHLYPGPRRGHRLGRSCLRRGLPWAYWPLAIAATGLGMWGIFLGGTWADPRTRHLTIALSGIAAAIFFQIVDVPFSWLASCRRRVERFLSEFELGYRPNGKHALSLDAPTTAVAFGLFFAFALLLIGLVRAVRYMNLDRLMSQLMAFAVGLALFGDRAEGADGRRQSVAVRLLEAAARRPAVRAVHQPQPFRRLDGHGPAAGHRLFVRGGLPLAPSGLHRSRRLGALADDGRGQPVPARRLRRHFAGHVARAHRFQVGHRQLCRRGHGLRRVSAHPARRPAGANDGGGIPGRAARRARSRGPASIGLSIDSAKHHPMPADGSTRGPTP